MAQTKDEDIPADRKILQEKTREDSFCVEREHGFSR